MKKIVIHLIPNAHLDPVWLWNAEEGFNEGITTCRTILDLMEEFPEMTFIRGEAAVYQHIEKHDPETFRRIETMVKAGRWDIVGANYIQPDTNLPATEPLARQFLHGISYFQKKFKKHVTAAWAADSFGHSAGLPEILAAAGIESFACTRPMPSEFRMESPAFWWEGSGGSRVLVWRPTHGWYGCERFDLDPRLDQSLQEAQKLGLGIGACFFGLGNHGGGPSREHLLEIRKWQSEHPEVEVVYSGLHGLFKDLRQRIHPASRSKLPVHRGEMNFCLRGCYVSLARVKFAYRRAENAVLRAESAQALTHMAGVGTPAIGDGLDQAWLDVLFNAFHDILPGSCIERAAEEQIDSLGRALQISREVEFDALLALCRKVRVSLPSPPKRFPNAVAFLVWNPNPTPFHGSIELEAGIDYRPQLQLKNRDAEVITEVRGPDGKPIHHQQIATEHRAVHDYPWRKRVVFNASIPACGWSVYTLGWVALGKPPKPKPSPVRAVGRSAISNGKFNISAKQGSKGIRITCDDRPLLHKNGLSAVTVEDPWGSWGGLMEEPDSLDLQKIRTLWTVSGVKVIESGPERACLWVLLQGDSSKIHLHFFLGRDARHIEVRARVIWNERSARLKLLMPCRADRAEYEVPGGTVMRGPSGEVPGGRWVRAMSGGVGLLGFASDAIYGFNLDRSGVFAASIVRSSRYADDYVLSAPDLPEIPCSDVGEFNFRFLISPGDSTLESSAEALERPLKNILSWPHDGELAPQGSLLSLHPSSLRLLAIKQAEDSDGFVIRGINVSPSQCKGRLVFAGQKIDLGAVAPGKIITWRLRPGKNGWTATRSNLLETNL